MASASNSSSAIAPRPANPANNRDRVAITGSPSAGVNTPATTAALTSPIECPITASGCHPVGTPQRGQRQLDPHQHRLDPLDPDHRLAGGQHVLQRKPGLRHEIGLQLGDRRGERRLVGQQPPTHPGPLRTLPRIHEHRARPARPVMRLTPPRAPAPRRPPPATRRPPGRDRRHTPWRTWRAGSDDG